MQISDSRLSNMGATAIADAFNAYRNRFRIITRRAALRFAEREWAAHSNDSVERLKLYSVVVDTLEEKIRGLMGDRIDDTFLWASIKAVYSGLIAERDDWELAETFFNSITRRCFVTRGVDPRIEFVDSDFNSPPTRSRESVYRTYDRQEDASVMVMEILTDYFPDAKWDDLARDVDAIAGRLARRLDQIGALISVDRTEVVRSVFYRGQAGYLVGRMFSGSNQVPFVLALANSESGYFVDAVLLSENEISILFSFARSYFHVDVARPHDLVHFLKSLMPRKRRAEIYIAVGEDKHGKTELYRDLLRHLQSSTGQFELARGTPGLVMICFTMPGFQDAFKIIRDKFPDVKKTTRKSIMNKYKMVFRHNRAGRLMDVQDFQHLKFDETLFAPSLLEELRTAAPDTVHIANGFVVIDHVYVERMVIPLDIYVREAGDQAASDAVIDFGKAIKDMASTNIFPGDLLLKNFGVTRHGRVVFYDYDELTELTEIRFRSIPPPRDDLDELSAEPWYSVGPRDVFPEEHRNFLGLSPYLTKVFESHHDDLYEMVAWNAIRQRVIDGEIIQVFAYSAEAQLPGTPKAVGWA
jgi:isocitrate dehydrogenase kinase/phosphatase